MGDPEQWVRETLDSGKRIMGFGHRIYRAEDPRSRILKGTARELGAPQIEVAEQLEEAAQAELERRHPERPLKTNVEFYSAIVLDVADIPPPLAPAMFACSRVAGWSAHILEQKRTGKLFRPDARYVGPAPRSLDRLTLAEAAAQADALAEEGKEREVADLRREWEDEVEAAARSADYRERAVAYRAVGQFRFRQKIELLRRGLGTRVPACRGSALSRWSGCRATRRRRQLLRAALHRLASADDNQAVRRLAVVSLRNGSPQPRHDRAAQGARRGRPGRAGLRETRKVAAGLKKKGYPP